MTFFFIGRCAFGFDTDVQNNPNNIYFRKAEEFFTKSALDKNVLYRSTQLVPQIGNILSRLFIINSHLRTLINTRVLPLISSTMQLNEDSITRLLNRLHTIVEQRQQTPTSRIDLLQLMLQVTSKETIVDNTEDSKTNYRLTLDEVVGNIFLFMVVGYETTSTALACATYELARNPDVLEKLQTEIDQLPFWTDNNDMGKEKNILTMTLLHRCHIWICLFLKS